MSGVPVAPDGQSHFGRERDSLSVGSSEIARFGHIQHRSLGAVFRLCIVSILCSVLSGCSG